MDGCLNVEDDHGTGIALHRLTPLEILHFLNLPNEHKDRNAEIDWEKVDARRCAFVGEREKNGGLLKRLRRELDDGAYKALCEGRGIALDMHGIIDGIVTHFTDEKWANYVRDQSPRTKAMIQNLLVATGYTPDVIEEEDPLRGKNPATFIEVQLLAVLIDTKLVKGGAGVFFG